MLMLLETMLLVVSSARVNHLRAGILMLAVVGQRDGDHFAARLPALHDDARVFHRQARSDVAVDPFDLRLFVRDAALGDEIEDVRTPVLDGDVLDLGALQGDEFDHGAVQRRRLEFRRRAAFHVHHLAAFIGDDERALELAEVFRVDSEIGLKRVLHLHARRHVDKRAAGEDGAVQRAELVVTGRDDLAKPLSEDLGMLVKALGRTDKDDALFADRLLDVRIGGLAVELRLDAGEEFALLLGNAETLEGPLDILGNLVP